MDVDFDAVVIGSGIGGLASAAVLAKLGGWKVLVLERHWRLGGFTHTFQRPTGDGRKWEWDVGLHYVGDLQDGGRTRKLFDLISEGRLSWARLPSPFDRFVYPDLTVDVPDDVDAFQRLLGERFPTQRDGLKRYFAIRRRADAEMGALIASKQLGRAGARRTRALVKHALRPTIDVVRDCVDDPRLVAVLLSQWGDYGVRPSEGAFGVHAAVSAHYDHGAWFPIGGSGAIVETVAPTIEAAGGALRAGVQVSSILVEDGRAVGVVANERGREITIRARHVFSNAGASVTYRELLPNAPPEILADLASLPPPPTVATLYLGLREPVTDLGCEGGNVWIFDDYDHDAAIDPLDGRLGVAYLSFPSARNPRAETHTAEVIVPLPHALVAKWSGARWRRRGADYDALKARLTARILARLEKLAPGFGARVAYHELSTPVTIERFTGHDRGAIYGLPATPARFAMPWLGARTPVRGLFLTGADVGLLGIAGAAMGGVLAAGVALGGFGLPALGDVLGDPRLGLDESV
ncbi:MAG: NAD(P)/FAD-dependent oxidoreductase [Polyangiales bacterium]